MKSKSRIVGLLIVASAYIAAGCSAQSANGTSGGGSSASGFPASSTTTTTTTTTTSSTASTVMAVQVVAKADATGSFDPTAVPLAGGTNVKASRIYNLDGTLITTSSVPAWFVGANVFLTSTRTTAGAVTYVGSDNPCAYFHLNTTDNNGADSSGYYTIDGFNPSVATVAGVDVDQCAGTAAAELNKTGMNFQIDRRFMNTTDKLQLIIKAKPIDAPNIAPTSSSCVVGGFFDGSACSNQYYTVTMRSAPYAAAKPFYILFPSAKALDLLSESVLLPISMDTSITTISIDRVKGGAIFYGMTLIRLQ